MADEGEQGTQESAESHPCPNCAAPVKGAWTPGADVKCQSCGHEFPAPEPLEYWDEGQWDEGLR